MLTKKVIVALIGILILAAGCVAPAAAPNTSDDVSAEVEEPADAPTAAPEDETIVIGMMTIVSHPSLDAIRQGVKDQLAEAGYIEGENLEIIDGNAEGDMATLTTIAQQFVDEGVDLIVATTTPAAQVAFNVTKDAEGPPVIYNGVSNPFTADLAIAPDDHPAWIFGNQLLDPVAEVMELASDLVSDLQIIGLIYNPAEANAVYLVEIAEAAAEEMGITLELASVSNSSEIQTAAESLVAQNIDALMVVNDNTVSSGFEAVVQTANENDIPLFGTSASYPPRGAAMSYGIDPYQEGLDSGDLVVRFLEGDLDLETAVIQVQDAVLLTVNPAAAAEQGLELPDELIESADKIIE